MQIQISDFENMFVFIAVGLSRKLKVSDDESVKAGLLFRQGMNLYTMLAIRYYEKRDSDSLKQYVNRINETMMIKENCTRPVKEWFLGWNEEVLAELEKTSFYKLNALVFCSKDNNTYQLTDECEDYLNSLEKDLNAVDEHIVFEKLKKLSQEDYVRIRLFLIEHPLMTRLERRECIVGPPEIDCLEEILNSAYEDTPQNTYECPNCGWTFTMIGDQPICCHWDCLTHINFSTNKNLEPVDSKYEYRLKKGVMKYISYPGRAEIEIKKKCEELHLKYELWPEHDRYDIKIIFQDGTCWGVDAKTYANPYLLNQSIKKDDDFLNANVNKWFYVIPDAIVNKTEKYLKISGEALKNKSQKCLSMRLFVKELRKEVKNRENK